MTGRPRSSRLSREDRLEEIRRLRRQGLTHREIADRLNVSVSTVANDLRSLRADASTADRSLRTDWRAATRRPDEGAGRLLRPVRAALRTARRRLP